MNQLVTKSCSVCSSSQPEVFFELPDMPVFCNLLWSEQSKAINCAKGDLKLAFCSNCGFIQNIAFDQAKIQYTEDYVCSLDFSPRFQDYAQSLAERLIERHNLRQKKIIEIGCGKGDFLLLLCELGNNRGVGIDPSVVPGRVESEAADRVTFIQDYYSEKHAEYVGDFICCRHTLEHIQPTSEFIKTVRKSIGDRNTAVVFEIPDNTRVLKDQAFEDIYYEHCSYFSPGTLARLFRDSGFEVTDLYCDYGDQYLLIETKPVALPSDKIHPFEETVDDVAADVQLFSEKITGKLDFWKQYLEEAQAKQEKVVVWGSGSKCVAFLTTLKTIDKIEYAVDINPHRHGKFIPGVGKEIMAPEFLKTYQPDKVIIMNAIYTQEISEMLDEMGVKAEVVAL